MSSAEAAPQRGTPRVVIPIVAFGIDGLFFTEWAQVRSGAAPTASIAGLALYLAAGCAALIERDRHPLHVFVLVWLWALTGAMLLPTRPAFTLLVALYALTVRSPTRVSLVALGACAAPFALTIAHEITSQPADRRTGALVANVVLNAAVTLSVWLIARQVRRRDERVVQLEDAHERIAREAVVSERRRLAGELHDIVSHAVSIMVLQAGGARRVLPDGNPDVSDALEVIEHKGQEAMAELRRLLTVLRDAGQLPPAEHLPQGIDHLDALAASFTAAGLPVEVTSTGQRQALDPSLDLTAFRVVKEALTNALKHGGAHVRADVVLDWTQGLRIEVVDTGQPSADVDPRLSTGTGLIGLRERVRALGGTLTAAPRPDGDGFEVHATLLAAPAGRD